MDSLVLMNELKTSVCAGRQSGSVSVTQLQQSTAYGCSVYMNLLIQP